MTGKNRTLPDAGADHHPGEGAFAIVGMGASAGGLGAFEDFFTHLSPDIDAAFVVVQHLDPTHASNLTSLIQRYTPLKVRQVTDGMEVRPKGIYVIPPNHDMTLQGTKLHLTTPVQSRGLRLPVDRFFHSLAEEREEWAVAIIFSGTGTDGTLGLQAVKGRGGMVMVQAPASARHDGMPRSAIATGLADYVLAPDQMPGQLSRYVDALTSGAGQTGDETDALQQLFGLLQAQTGHDFARYKRNTVRRRIQRRMRVKQVQNLAGYVRCLRQDPLEVEKLFRELLIRVTRFFRDSEAFEALAHKVIPQLLENASPGQPLRVWVPGCATGEEAYSIAILLQEQMAAREQRIPLEIFATDIDEQAVARARAGIYPESIAADLSSERLSRFFIHEEGSYRVGPEIRDVVVLAVQSVVKDPPFSRLDLISCRNLLIYLTTELQQQVVPTFHYALKPGGFLFLGQSETLGRFGDYFATLDRQHKLFQRPQDGPALRAGLDFAPPVLAGRSPAPSSQSLRQVTQKMLLELYAPSCVVVDRQGQILYFHGRTGRYLEPAPGAANLNVLRMAREGLRGPLTAALGQAVNRKQEVVYERVQVLGGDGPRAIRLTVRPISGSASVLKHSTHAMQGLSLVLFEELEPVPHAGPADVDASGQRVGELEQDLRATKERLRITIEELETSNEELRSTNEELQSFNEELEAAQEEMQSANEELATVNAELARKIEQLTQANNDMVNLLANVETGIIFLDQRLQIRRFNLAATRVINLIETDVGRPIGHIASNLAHDGLDQEARTVLDSRQGIEHEVQARDGRWYVVRVRPYRTPQGAVEGVVLTFSEVTEQKQMQAEIEQHRQHLEHLVDERTAELQRSKERVVNILESISDAFFALDDDLTVTYFNRAAEQVLHRDKAEVLDRPLFDAFPEARGSIFEEKYRQAIREKRTMTFETYFGVAPYENWYAVKAYPQENGLSVYFQVITERKRAEAALKASEQQFRTIVENLPAGAVYRQGDQIHVNRAIETLTGYSKETLATLDDWFELLYRERAAQVRETYASHQAERFSRTEITPITCKDGTVRWVEFAGSYVDVDKDIWVVHDITEKRRAQEQLRATLEEKETLLRELYHRTKNNMQMICAMLDLQSDHLSDPEALRALVETQTRIQSMALVHQKLYESQTLSTIDLDIYVGDLVQLLMQSYPVHPNRVSVALDLDPVTVLIDIAIPCGLILNELISNALQHAFPENRAGEIHIRLARTAPNEVLLRVSDDGVGVPSGFDLRDGDTFGLQLVLIIGERQLRGRVAFETETGVTCRVQFKDDLYDSRV